jgi:ADP-heptose:LPS heptosyltransferase
MSVIRCVQVPGKGAFANDEYGKGPAGGQLHASGQYPEMSMLVQPSGVRRILIIKLRAIGDVVLSTIVIPNLRRAYPDASIEFLTEKSAAPVVLNHRDVDDVIVFDRSSAGSVWLLREVRRRRFDLVIDLFGNPRTALVTKMSGAIHRVGFRFRGRTYAYNRLVTPRGGAVHNTQFNLDALEAIGIPIVERTTHFPMSKEDGQFAEEFFAQSGVGRLPVVALNSGGGWYTKRWSLDRFADLGNRIVADFHLRVLLVWGPGEADDVAYIRSRLNVEPLIPPLTSLGQLGALLKRCSLLITNDSGPMHIGAALGTPVVAIFGPTNPELQGPYGVDSAVIRFDHLHCLGCNLTQCPIGHPCMRGLSVEAVVNGVRQFLEKVPTSYGTGKTLERSS